MDRQFGTMPGGEPVSAFTLSSDTGLQLTVLDLGATVQSIRVPTGAGTSEEVVLGFDDAAGYTSPDNPYLGASVGRYANRIAEASFELDGQTYAVSANEGPTSLHGGVEGFHARVWAVVDSGSDRLTLQLVSVDGDQGFPGTLTATATYAVDGDAVTIDYEATCDAPTVVSLTNHAYFALGGSDGGGADAHVLTVHADEYLPVTPASTPEGRTEPVSGTPFDLTTPTALGPRVRSAHPQVARVVGIDHTFVLRGTGVRPAARLEHPGTGRALEVETDQPTIQVYTGNRLDGSLAGHEGRLLRQGDGICLETQRHPDAPNQPSFPSAVLRPGQTYRSHTRWTFSA
ncbi:aldose epimerase family protein [Knoellia sp. CPCC 206435]|uniref:aldose epimerase family protein n=1 Tax=Knoellia terrae TaxID=3404797 RepID=UPI003B42C2E0